MIDRADELAKKMAEISQRAFCAEWMDGLEYALWRLAVAGGGAYGQTIIDADEARDLLRMASLAGSWITTNDDGEESAVPLAEWLRLYSGSSWMSVAVRQRD